MALKTLLTNLESGLNAYPNHNTPDTSGGFNYGKSYSRLFDTKEFRQRNFEFGKGNAFDRKGEGFSREPFMKFKLPDANDDGSLLEDILDGVDTFTDGLIRGGVATAVKRSVKDAARIAKFYISNRGITFLAKQVALQLAQPNMESGATKFLGKDFNNNRTYNLGINTLAQTLVNFTGIHFDRAGISPIWKDEDKYGKWITRENYADTAGNIKNNELDGGGNRLLTLHKVHILEQQNLSAESESAIDEVAGESEATAAISQAEGETKESNLLYQYKSGPDSIYGLGSTRIRKFTSTFEGDNKESIGSNIKLDVDQRNRLNTGVISSDTFNPFNASLGKSYNNLNNPIEQFYFSNRMYRTSGGQEFVPNDTWGDLPSELKLPNQFLIDNKGIGRTGRSSVSFPFFTSEIFTGFALGNDIRGNDEYIAATNHTLNLSNLPNIKNYLFTLSKPGFNYTKKTDDGNERYYIREQRINAGNPGVGVGNGDTQFDELGNLVREDGYIQQTNSGGTLNYNVFSPSRVDQLNALDIFETKGQAALPGLRDLIRFRFEAVNTEEPNKSDIIVFRAFLDDFSDQFSAQHNEFKYNGRGEPFYTYNSFNRSISLSFKIAAQSRHEMMPLYRKLNYLVSNTAPEYSPTGRMRTPFMRLTVGAWCDRLPGVLKGVNLKWQKDYPWEISIDSPEKGQDTHMLVLPHVLDVSVTYQPIHNFLPEKFVKTSNDAKRTLAPFILPHTNNRKLNPAQRWYSVPIEDVGGGNKPQIEKAQGLGVKKLAEIYQQGEKDETGRTIKGPVQQPKLFPNIDLPTTF